MNLQELSDEARFWGAFGFYALVTLVCSVISIVCFEDEFKTFLPFCWFAHLL